MNNSNPNSLVRKSNLLAYSFGRLNLQEKRLVAYAISHLCPGDTTFPALNLHVTAFADLFGLPRNSTYQEVKELVRSLIRKPVEFEDEEHKYIASWVRTLRYTKASGQVRLTFNDDLAQYILGLQNNYTQYRLRDVYQFKSNSGWNVYEALRKHKAQRKVTYPLAEFKGLVAADDQYSRFFDFERRILGPAIAEINAKTDLLVDWERVTQGRRITALRFHLADNQTTKTPREKIREKAEKALGGQPCLAPDLAKLLREDYRVNAKQAKALADLAAGDREAEVRSMLPKLRKRWENLPESKRVALGGYVFKALKAHLSQGTLI